MVTVHVGHNGTDFMDHKLTLLAQDENRNRVTMRRDASYVLKNPFIKSAVAFFLTNEWGRIITEDDINFITYAN